MFHTLCSVLPLGIIFLASIFALAGASPTSKPELNPSGLLTGAIPLQPWAWETIPFVRSPSDLDLERRVVYNPPITSPSVGAVWTAGSQESVTWSTSKIPPQLILSTSTLMLGHRPKSGKGGLNLHRTLAKDFPLVAGKVSFILPADLPRRTDYLVVLFGDSGNASPHFTIVPSESKSAHSPQDLELISLLNKAVGEEDDRSVWSSADGNSQKKISV